MKKRSILFLVLVIICLGCNKVGYQKIIIDNNKKTISLLDTDFVIDSISIMKFGKPKLSISLINKEEGASYVSINHPDAGYVYADRLSTLDCDDQNFSVLIIVRKKGAAEKVTNQTNIKTNKNIQVASAKYVPCSNEIDTLETVGSFK